MPLKKIILLLALASLVQIHFPSAHAQESMPVDGGESGNGSGLFELYLNEAFLTAPARFTHASRVPGLHHRLLPAFSQLIENFHTESQPQLITEKELQKKGLAFRNHAGFPGRIAVTGSRAGSPVYINVDQIYHPLTGEPLFATNEVRQAAYLIHDHEFLHHYGIIDDDLAHLGAQWLWSHGRVKTASFASPPEATPTRDAMTLEIYPSKSGHGLLVRFKDQSRDVTSHLHQFLNQALERESAGQIQLQVLAVPDEFPGYFVPAQGSALVTTRNPEVWQKTQIRRDLDPDLFSLPLRLFEQGPVGTTQPWVMGVELEVFGKIELEMMNVFVGDQLSDQVRFRIR